MAKKRLMKKLSGGKIKKVKAEVNSPATSSESDGSDLDIFEHENYPQELVDEEDEELQKLKEKSLQSNLFNLGENSESSPYEKHFTHELNEDELAQLVNKFQVSSTVSWESLHCVQMMQRKSSNATDKEANQNFLQLLSKQPIQNPDDAELLTRAYGTHKTLATNWLCLNNVKTEYDDAHTVAFTSVQKELYAIMHQYISLYYPLYKTTENADEIRKLYCLHAMNHVLQARTAVLKNNKLISKLTDEQVEQAEFRDQGVVRPKVLILAPFRENVNKILNILLQLLKTEKKFEISYLKRFKEEFDSNAQETEDKSSDEKVTKKPLDHREIFSGNTDEHFRIGIALLHSAFRLYAPFYSSDIIIASPLGLRTIIGEKGEHHYEYDFLSSIEMLILDMADVFLMQNWEHVLHVMKHMHLQPKESHGVDFTRVRTSSLDHQDKHYCQTIVLSSVSSPQISSLLTKYCHNYKGLIMVQDVVEKGAISTITKSIPQIYHRLNVTSEPFSEVQAIRFKFFLEQIWKQVKEKKMAGVLIYIPQYFDFVRLRNHLRREKKAASGPHFGYICEYTKPTEVGKARRRFFTGKFPVLLYTERYHFYHRASLRGVKHLIFYELPTYPHFYSELCNVVRASHEENCLSAASISVLYSKYDAGKLVSVLGTVRADTLFKSQKNLHMFVTGN